MIGLTLNIFQIQITPPVGWSLAVLKRARLLPDGLAGGKRSSVRQLRLLTLTFKIHAKLGSKLAKFTTQITW
jgi:hypothetical protein